MTIEELCSKLQQKRNSLGITLEEAVEKTKLYPSVIRDIESCNLGSISGAYIKGYIRIYASFLGVDIEGALDNISLSQANISKKTVKIEKKEAPESQRQKINFQFKPIPPQIKKIIFYVIALVFIAWIVSGIIGVISKTVSKNIKKPTKRTEQKTVRLPSVSKKIQGEVNASLTAKRDCFIRVKVDGKVLFEGVLKKGMSENWKGSREIEFRIADGSAVYLEVNGKSLPALTSSRKSIKSLKVNSSGISVIK